MVLINPPAPSHQSGLNQAMQVAGCRHTICRYGYMPTLVALFAVDDADNVAACVH